jgi:hypothetical protein
MRHALLNSFIILQEYLLRFSLFPLPCPSPCLSSVFRSKSGFGFGLGLRFAYPNPSLILGQTKKVGRDPDGPSPKAHMTSVLAVIKQNLWP